VIPLVLSASVYDSSLYSRDEITGQPRQVVPRHPLQEWKERLHIFFGLSRSATVADHHTTYSWRKTASALAEPALDRHRFGYTLWYAKDFSDAVVEADHCGFCEADDVPQAGDGYP
jgi:hypothetical protein